MFSKMRLVIIALCMILLLSACMKAETPFAKRPEVDQFINRMSQKHGFEKETLVSLFGQVEIRPDVVRQIKQPFEKQTWRKYQALLVNAWRIQNGVQFWHQHQTTLQRAHDTYGVPPSIIVATLGIETRYGKNMGKYRVMDALSNLAFNHAPRATYFKQELEQFLLLSRDNHLDPLSIKGSYAGAIGQPQFMPSSYRYYAVDFSHTGNIDLMNNTTDVIGSIANYYQKNGWVPGGKIASPVRNMRLHQTLASLKNQKKTLAEWKKLGITGTSAPASNEKATLIELDNRDSKEYWLGYRNFEIIKRYNASNLYAMAVFQLSRYLDELKGSGKHGSKNKA